MLVHALNVVFALTMMVDMIDDDQEFVTMIQRLIRAHARRNVRETQFRNLRSTLLVVMAEELGPKVMTKQAKESWKKATDVILDTALQYQQEEEEKKE